MTQCSEQSPDGGCSTMKTARIFCALTAACCLGLAAGASSCSGPTGDQHAPRAGRTLSPGGAAELAAKLANDECARLYKRRPFAADQHPAVLLEDGRYHWGGLDQAGTAGYSADVTFAPDGSHPKVEVYFSTDRLDPLRISPTPPRPRTP